MEGFVALPSLARLASQSFISPFSILCTPSQSSCMHHQSATTTKRHETNNRSIAVDAVLDFATSTVKDSPRDEAGSKCLQAKQEIIRNSDRDLRNQPRQNVQL